MFKAHLLCLWLHCHRLLSTLFDLLIYYSYSNGVVNTQIVLLVINEIKTSAKDSAYQLLKVTDLGTSVAGLYPIFL